MAGDYSELGELFLHVNSINARLDASHHVFFINPQNFVHACHIDRDYHALFMRTQEKVLSCIGAAAERD
jgi:hypothetical protein